MGISDYRARKIEQQALRKLRSISVAQGGLAHQP